MSTHRDIGAWLASYVNDTHFQCALEGDIDALEKPTDRVRARLELLSYLAPKVKGVDAPAPDQNPPEINITYTEAKPPKKAGRAPNR